MVELCIHVANLFYLASFLGRDMLWLRTLTCAGLVFGIVFFTCQPMPLYGPTVWHLVFLAINAVQIWRLVRERRALMLTAEQERVAEATFQHLSREELLTLLAKAMHDHPERIRDPQKAARQPLTPEERALRDIAFRRLSRGELLNLLTRRLWSTIKRLNPARWRHRGVPAAAPVPPPAGTAPGPVHG